MCIISNRMHWNSSTSTFNFIFVHFTRLHYFVEVKLTPIVIVKPADDAFSFLAGSCNRRFSCTWHNTKIIYKTKLFCLVKCKHKHSKTSLGTKREIKTTMKSQPRSSFWFSVTTTLSGFQEIHWANYKRQSKSLENSLNGNYSMKIATWPVTEWMLSDFITQTCWQWHTVNRFILQK